ncbi:rhodanese-like domain-containing protein [Gelidibacter sp.]|uniref:rhodanese-like domain-containing protein n=1 Tax=Gelidibacter sp. TaxID=2018083 RepID=UPI00326710B1
MKRISLIFIVVFTFLIIGCKKESDDQITLVTPEEMLSLMEMDDVQLVDVRSAKDRIDGFIKNSQNIDFNSPTFDQDIQKLDKTKPVILYCRSGGRSAKCAKKLKDAGFVKIYDLKGGMTQWLFDDHDVEVDQ